MRKGWCSVDVGAWFLVALLAAEVHETAAVHCVPMELRPCLPAITGSGNPSKLCCSKLREQQPCYCDYLSDPPLKNYIDSPNVLKVAKACNVTVPKCASSPSPQPYAV